MKKGDVVICIKRNTNSTIKEKIIIGKKYKVMEVGYYDPYKNNYNAYLYCKVDKMKTYWPLNDFKVCTREMKLKRILKTD